jgi:type II secretion system protein H
MGNKGFTLVEILIVVALMGFAAALVSPALSRFSQSIELRTTAQRISGILRHCRNEAIQQGTIQQVILDAGRRELRICRFEPLAAGEEGQGGKREEAPKERRYGLPEGILIEEIKVSPGQSALEYPVIEFYPNGGSNGGSFRIDRENQKGYRIQVHFLTGIVEVKMGGTT